MEENGKTIEQSKPTEAEFIASANKTTEVVDRGDTRVKDALDAKQRERATKPSKADIQKAMEEQDKVTYTQNSLILEQIKRHELKVIGNAQFNEDEYKRKKGRMKMVTFTYEYEKDEQQQVIDEAMLEQVYTDTKNALSIELEKIEMGKTQIQAQQDRLLKSHPSFKELVCDVEALAKKYEEKTKRDK